MLRKKQKNISERNKMEYVHVGQTIKEHFRYRQTEQRDEFFPKPTAILTAHKNKPSSV
jgi:hypothetical protein